MYLSLSLYIYICINNNNDNNDNDDNDDNASGEALEQAARVVDFALADRGVVRGSGDWG